MKKFLTLLLVLTGIFTFVACDGEVNLELYTKDLISSIKSDDSLAIPATIIVEGMSERYEYDFLEDFIDSFSNPRYVEYDYQTSLAFDIEVPVITKKQLETFDDDGVLFEIVRVKTKTGYSFYINLNNDLISRINSYTSSSMFQSFNLSDFDFNYKLINNDSNTRKYRIYSSYINKKAYPTSHDLELSQRYSTSVKLSEVLMKAYSQNDKTYFLKIMNVE